MCSSDLNRIIALCDGRKAGEYDGRADKEEILSAIIGANTERKRSRSYVQREK